MNPPSHGKFKADLRRQLIAKRRALRGAERAAATRRIAARVGSLPQFKPGSRVAVYAAFGSELDPAPVIRAAARRGIRLYVPVVTDLARRRMRFVPLSSSIRPGIERTPGRHAHHIAARWFHLILCPVVGIDGRGYRLGMGAGFFDRALTFRRLRRHWRGPKLIALAFDCQRIESVHPDVWDARLDGLISESGLHLFLQGSA
jgi:5-formyltetrahydrofolate cyclo-ligase